MLNSVDGKDGIGAKVDDVKIMETLGIVEKDTCGAETCGTKD